MKPLRAEILAIGSELLHGGRVDSNSLFIAEMLAQCGIRVEKKMALSDELREIRSALRASVRHADVVIVTGGLGSTLDDRTREAVTAAFGRPLAVRSKAMQILKRKLEERGRLVTPLLARQALLPKGATILKNLTGTAPGFYLQEGKAHVFVLPGVPREARAMMEGQVTPVIKKNLKTSAVLWWHAFNTTGLPETDIQETLWPVLQKYSCITLSLLASVRGVKVTLSRWLLKDQSKKKLNRVQDFPEADSLIQQVRTLLGPWLFSEGETTMEEVVGQLMAAQGWTLALAESCTGGLIAHRLTEVSGSSHYLDRGMVTYSNKAKQELLGVPPGLIRKHGAVSQQVAEAMARGIRAKSRVHLGVSVTGIAGPGGGSTEKPVGMVYMAIDGPRGGQSLCCQFWGNRTEIKFRSSQAALNMIRRYLLQSKR